MIKIPVRKICRERFKEWTDVLVENESTPLAMISVGHNTKRGEINGFGNEGLSSETISEVFRYAANKLDRQKKGGNDMPELPKEIEIQRVMNLVIGFGWNKIREEIVGTKVQITIEKEMFVESEITGPGPPA